MKYLIPALLSGMALLVACRHAQAPPMSLKDTMVKRHFSRVEKLPYYDTEVPEFKILKAYYTNDTPYFVQLGQDMKNEAAALAEADTQQLWKSPPYIGSLHADEAYRFRYGMSFNYNLMEITVTRNDSDASLSCMIYKYTSLYSTAAITEQYEKKLTPAEWEAFTGKLYYADFWGLQPDNGMHGLDGSELSVEGFKGKKFAHPAAHRISRWSPEHTAIYEAFDMLVKLSGYHGSLSKT